MKTALFIQSADRPRSRFFRSRGLVTAILFCLVWWSPFLLKAREVRVAIDAENAPYEYVDLDGKIKGFLPDLLRHLESVTELKFTFYPMSQPDAVAQLAAGKVDLISLIPTPQRKEQFLFSAPHSRIYQALFKNQQQVEIVDTLSLSGHLVAFQADALALRRLEHQTGFKRVIVRRREEGFYRLNNNRVGAFITAEQSGLYFIRRHQLNNVTIAQGHLWPRDFCFASRPEDRVLIQKLNLGLDTLMATGAYNDLFERWFHKPERWVRLHSRLVGYTFIGLFILAVVFLVLTIRARRTIRTRLQQLKESEKLFRTLAEESPNLVFVNQMGPVVYANKTCAEVTGYSVPEMTDPSFNYLDLIHPEDRDMIRENYARHRQGENVPPYKYRLVTKAGEILVLLGHYSLIRFGGRDAILGIATDVTQLEKQEQEIRDSEHRYRTLVEEMSQGLYTIDREGTFTFSNRAQAEILGFREGAALIGRNIMDFVHPDHRKEVAQMMSRAIETKTMPERLEHKIIRTDGSHGFIEVQPRLIIEKDEVVGARGLITDISERKKTEEMLVSTQSRLSGILQSIADLVFVFDTEGKFIFAHAPSPDMLYLEEELFIHRHPEDVLPEDITEQFKAAFDQVIMGKTVDLRYNLLMKDGKHWYTMKLSPILKENQFMGAIGIARDETERVEQEQELIRHRTHLEDLVVERTKEIESFAYSISHDLKSPLRAISGFARILEQEYGNQLDQEGHRLINVITDNVTRMNDLITGLLSLSRIGRKKLNYTTIDMNQLVKETIQRYEEEYGGRDITWSIRALPPVEGDAVLLRQVWQNLIQNALKFTANEPRTIIEIDGETTENKQVYTIRDNGVGFDEEYATKLFQVFSRLHGRDEFEGLGIGLALVKRVIQRHGGEIQGTSKPGEGAIFRFWLPRKPGKEIAV